MHRGDQERVIPGNTDASGAIRPGNRPETVLASAIPTTPRRRSEVTKAEFIDQVADRAGLSKKDASEAVDAVLETIEDALKRGSDVVFSGFGKFSVSARAAREGRNRQLARRSRSPLPRSRSSRLAPPSRRPSTSREGGRQPPDRGEFRGPVGRARGATRVAARARPRPGPSAPLAASARASGWGGRRVRSTRRPSRARGRRALCRGDRCGRRPVCRRQAAGRVLRAARGPPAGKRWAGSCKTPVRPGCW